MRFLNFALPVVQPVSELVGDPQALISFWAALTFNALGTRDCVGGSQTHMLQMLLPPMPLPSIGYVFDTKDGPGMPVHVLSLARVLRSPTREHCIGVFLFARRLWLLLVSCTSSLLSCVCTIVCRQSGWWGRCAPRLASCQLPPFHHSTTFSSRWVEKHENDDVLAERVAILSNMD